MIVPSNSSIAKPTSLSSRTKSVLVLGIGSLLASLAQAQITFTPPVDAPGGGVGTVGILEVTNNGGMGDQNNARTSLTAGGTRITGSGSVIDYYNSDGTGHFGNNIPFLSDPNPGNGGTNDVDNIAIMYRGTINVPAGGNYTFGVNSDDGFTLVFDGGTSPFTSANGGNGAALQTYNGNANGAFQFLGGRGASDSLAQINLPAGNHPFSLTFHEGGGGSGVELFAASGFKSAFDHSFNLVGGNAFTVPGSQVGTIGSWDYKAIADGNADLNSMIAKYNNNNPTVGTGGLSGGAIITSVNVPRVNFHDPQGSNTGSHGADAFPFPGDTPADDNNFGGAGRALLTITPAQAGIFTFGVYSDDSFRFRLIEGNVPTGNGSGDVDLFSATNAVGANTDGDGADDAFTTGGCCTDYLGRYNLAAGEYTIEAIFNEQGGGAGFLLYGAPGDQPAFNANFRLLGGDINTPAGLAVVPEPGSAMLGLLGGFALLSSRRRRK